MTVCTGNICRSPMAEVVLRDRFEAAGLGDRVEVDSSGVSDEESGNPIDPRAASVLREAGYPVPRHRAHGITADELGCRDLLLAMTARHARTLRTRAADGPTAARVRMWRSFDPSAPPTSGPDAVADESDLDVADPWYGGRDLFVSTLQQVEAAADGIVEFVRRELAARDGSGRHEDGDEQQHRQ
ncbi:low molecular weight phosphotyrosine protein phosphatase [Amnibacterium sp. CER49]|uniref:low molecular weight protein-tyrosine-phosphatase n=1 Tax=Amnibacterium sp. CER49 TaxID=3039161 RepID=UPI00244BC576|nr:low molecular weight phosphotyrosine protein phosphatase [Amnibacterium sp. CER49]MDH2443694.1 low molecular weight phosphotyrosine protein phosphatase [Amnibacterium sp. CER49]